MYHTFSCAEDCVEIFRGIGTSSRWSTTVMCSESRQKMAVPCTIREYAKYETNVARHTFTTDYGCNLSSSSRHTALLHSSKSDAVPPTGVLLYPHILIGLDV